MSLIINELQLQSGIVLERPQEDSGELSIPPERVLGCNTASATAAQKHLEKENHLSSSVARIEPGRVYSHESPTYSQESTSGVAARCLRDNDETLSSQPPARRQRLESTEDILDTWVREAPKGEAAICVCERVGRVNARRRITKFLSENQRFLSENQPCILELSYLSLSSLPEIFDDERFQRLTSLGLRVNRLTTLPDSIGNLSVISLDLARNQLTGLPNAILQLSRNTTISIERNPLSKDVITRLREATEREDYRGPRFTFDMSEQNPRQEDSMYRSNL